jgi:phosphoribosylformylglycinamidine synthase
MHLSEAPTSLLILGALPTWHGASMAAHVIESLGGLEDGALLGTDPPPLDLPLLRRTIDARMEANAYITACHDVSEGGIALGILEMLAAHRGTPSTIGCALDLSSLPSSLCSATALFGETRAFIIAVQPKNIDACMAIAKKHDVPCTPIGSTTPNRTFDVMRDGTSLCSCDVDDLEKIRQESLRKALRGPGTLGA